MSKFVSARWASPLIAAAGAAFVLAACGQGQVQKAEPRGFAAVDTARISTESAGNEWLTYGGTYDEQRHSKLTAINKENVSQLGVAWTYDLATNRGVESTPIVVDGTMYVTSAWSVVYALDAKTGAEKWVYDPQADRAVGVKACCDVVNRGVAVYDGKVYVGVIDGRLEALNAETGEVIWSKVTVDQDKPYTITGAPRVVNGKVLIGNGGAELGVRGYLSAYDTSSGDLVWRFYTVPNPLKQPDGAASDDAFVQVGNVTWGDEGAWTTDGGGGTVWDSIVYDEVNNQIIFGVGNGSPWNRTFRDPAGGDNLFLSSIVAVDVDTGAYKWHFQTTPGDNWDYTATQTIILADLPLGENGTPRRVAMQAPKNGFFYVLDAATGEFLSGDAYVPMNWATGLDENGRPIAPPEVAKFLRASLKGRLIAWDPVARAPRWTVEHENAWNGGVLSTAGGLVFQGKLNGEFVAYDAATGEKLWSHNLKSGGASGPGTFMIDGEQYVTITTGWGSAFALAAGFAYDEKVPSTVGKVVTFKIGGTGEIADSGLAPVDATPKGEAFGSMAVISEGAVHYARNCAVCHGPLGVSSGVLPDLRWSAITANTDAWKGVVLEGNLAANGMVSFAEYITPDEAEAIRAYVLTQAHAAAGE
ncbi:PQQ-dependent dehydrogenase, methanol/ethanol family [Hyphomonas sp. NPDC076900]|uniref:PQQ-dependent dehydrogenase, methanol/ethanol family n=1 Tax=unclassified Hyphomonas TaxID=2630699 RepID=UPI003CFFBB89